jgi:hypothetical protein
MAQSSPIPSVIALLPAEKSRRICSIRPNSPNALSGFGILWRSINGGYRLALSWELQGDPLVTRWLHEGTQFVTLTREAQERIATLEYRLVNFICLRWFPI